MQDFFNNLNWVMLLKAFLVSLSEKDVQTGTLL